MYTILYVDDESPLLDLCKLFLERTGDFTIETHISAQSALEALTKTSFDCIVSDYQMPEMDGIQFLQTLRSQGDTTPFIIFTGKGREEVAIQALNSGADFYLQKGGEAKAQYIELAHMITQAVCRKKGEEALRESEMRYRNVVESQTEFIVRFLPDGTHKVANAAYCRYFGKSCEEMINSRFIPNIQENDKGRVRQHFTSLTPENSVATIEYRIVMPDGSVRWQQWSDRAIFDANGILLEYQSVGRDITERKRAEEELLRKNEELQAAYEEVTTAEEELQQNYDELVAMEKKLRESEQQYRNVVEDQTELISRFLPDGTCVFVNEAYCRYFNKKREEILGTKFIPEISEEDQSFVKQHFASLNRNTPVAMIEHRIVMPGGQVRWQRWSDRAIFDAEGHVTEYQSVGWDTTDRKEAEGLLLRSEIRYRSLFEGVPVGLYRTTPAGQILDANPALMHILDYPDLESLQAISVPDLYANPEARKEWQARIEHDGIVRNFEVQFYKCDGIIIWVRETSKVVRDNSGQIVYYEGILEDITERKRVEEALLGREIQLTNAMNLANLVNWEYDIDSRMFTFDDRFYEMYGTSAEREGGTLMPADIYFREFVHPDDLPTVLNVVRAVQETIDSHHTVQLEHRIIRRDGEVRDIVVRLTGIVNNEGRIVRHFGANQDITDRKRAEDALRESEEKYRAFFTTSMDCVFITSIDGRWLDFNDSAVRFFGYASRDELQKVNVRDLYENSRDRKRHLAYIKEKGYSKEYPVNLKKKDGTIINTLITTVPRKDRDGIIIGFQGTIQDITESKQIEEELRRKNEELHVVYEELTTTEEELRQNYDELSKAERNLRESERKYRTIFENTGTATVLVEENTVISLANAEFERLSGYSKQEIEGKKSWTEFVVKEDLDQMSDQHRLRRERQGAALKHYEFRFITKSGDIRNILLTVDIIPDSKRSVASLMDITEPKKTEMI
jgi:PAS domain S-box-containing protein